MEGRIRMTHMARLWRGISTFECPECFISLKGIMRVKYQLQIHTNNYIIISPHWVIYLLFLTFTILDTFFRHTYAFSC